MNPHSQKAQPTAVGEYIDLYREICGTTPLLNGQECAVIERLAAWARSQSAGPDRSSVLEEAAQYCYVCAAASGEVGIASLQSAQIAMGDHLRALRNAAPQGTGREQSHAGRDAKVDPATAPAESAPQPEAGADDGIRRFTPEDGDPRFQLRDDVLEEAIRAVQEHKPVAWMLVGNAANGPTWEDSVWFNKKFADECLEARQRHDPNCKGAVIPLYTQPTER